MTNTTRRLLKIAVIGSYAFVFLSAARCQSLSPVAEEFSAHAKGTFVARNAGVAPLDVTVEAISFDMVNGKQLIKPLDSSIAVKIKQPHFVIGPHAQHFVDFDAQSTIDAQYHFVLLVHFSQLKHNAEGLSVTYVLGAAVYGGCHKARGCRKFQLTAMGVQGQ